MSKFLKGLVATLSLVLLVACGKTETNKLVVGATPVPHAELLELVKDDLKDQGIDLEIVVFNDYVQPNLSLGDKSLDANFFQHVPYMNDFGAKNNLDLVSVGNVHLEPIKVYSDKIKSLEELKENDTVLIPNDPTNGGRSLILLDKAGIIKLNDNTKLDARLSDIVDNPKNIEIVELNADQIAPRLSEVSAAIINSNYAIDAGLTNENVIYVETKESPYANIITVIKGRENDENIKKLVKALQSDKVKKYIEEKYNGDVVVAF